MNPDTAASWASIAATAEATATTMRDFYRHHTFTDTPGAEHELWHPNYLQAIKTTLDRIKAQSSKAGFRIPNAKA